MKAPRTPRTPRAPRAPWGFWTRTHYIARRGGSSARRFVGEPCREYDEWTDRPLRGVTMTEWAVLVDCPSCRRAMAADGAR